MIIELYNKCRAQVHNNNNYNKKINNNYYYLTFMKIIITALIYSFNVNAYKNRFDLQNICNLKTYFMVRESPWDQLCHMHTTNL